MLAIAILLSLLPEKTPDPALGCVDFRMMLSFQHFFAAQAPRLAAIRRPPGAGGDRLAA
jgi:hypothetical protein